MRNASEAIMPRLRLLLQQCSKSVAFRTRFAIEKDFAVRYTEYRYLKIAGTHPKEERAIE
jgi:hypothetical protein